jgi:hypothetical protein
MLTEQMSRNWALEIDVFVAILLVEGPANVGVYVLIQGFQLFPQSLQVLLKRGSLVQRPPKRPVVRVSYDQEP